MCTRTSNGSLERDCSRKENVVNIKSLASGLNEGKDAWDRGNEDTKQIT